MNNIMNPGSKKKIIDDVDFISLFPKNKNIPNRRSMPQREFLKRTKGNLTKRFEILDKKSGLISGIDCFPFNPKRHDSGELETSNERTIDDVATETIEDKTASHYNRLRKKLKEAEELRDRIKEPIVKTEQVKTIPKPKYSATERKEMREVERRENRRKAFFAAKQVTPVREAYGAAKTFVQSFKKKEPIGQKLKSGYNYVNAASDRLNRAGLIKDISKAYEKGLDTSYIEAVRSNPELTTNQKRSMLARELAKKEKYDRRKEIGERYELKGKRLKFQATQQKYAVRQKPIYPVKRGSYDYSEMGGGDHHRITGTVLEFFNEFKSKPKTENEPGKKRYQFL